ncbi:MAG: esterase family protein [Chloroflexota bacterium]|nr:esterase family protein [Chloroflexota bacterium]
MTTATINFRSASMNQLVSYSVILPDRGEGPFPVLIQLHGLSDDHLSWIHRSNLVRHVENFPLIVVMPNGGTSGHLNWRASERLIRHLYEDLLANDIPDHVQRHFNATDGPWAIGGLSMGGYGAMRLGLKYPDRFASIWAHSSAFHIERMVEPALIGDVEDADVFRHAERVAASATQPVIAFDCGVDDERLIGHNRELHAHMDRIGLSHHYAEHPGGHTWEYQPHTLPLVSWTASEIETMAA